MADTKISKMLKDEAVQQSFAVAYPDKWQPEIEDPENPGEMIANPESLQAFCFRQVESYVLEIHGAAWDKNKKAEHESDDATDKQAEKDRIDNL